MEEIRFNNVEELYTRLKPAIHSKLKELMRNKMFYIEEEDIWNYLSKYKWHDAIYLTLSDMVDDILNTSNEEYDNYFKNKFKKD